MAASLTSEPSCKKSIILPIHIRANSTQYQRLRILHPRHNTHASPLRQVSSPSPPTPHPTIPTNNPLGVLIACSILICVFLNDHFAKKGAQTRCYFILIFLIPNICGSFGLAFLAADNKAGRLICYYLTGPYNAAFVMILSLTTANTAGHTKKVVTNAILFLGYCTGNIAGPFFYKTDQSPRYQLGIWSMIVSHLLEVCVIITLRVILSRENKRRDRVQSQQPGGLEGRDLDATAFSDMTDRENANFRYIY